MNPHKGFTLDLLEGVVYNIFRCSVELNDSRPRAFDQFVTLVNIQ